MRHARGARIVLDVEARKLFRFSFKTPHKLHFNENIAFCDVTFSTSHRNMQVGKHFLL